MLDIVMVNVGLLIIELVIVKSKHGELFNVERSRTD